MRPLILCCSCHNMWKTAAEAYCHLFPTSVLPEVVRGRDRIYKLALETGNPHIKAISKLGGKYAFYLELDENNNITKEYNLITKARIQ